MMKVLGIDYGTKRVGVAVSRGTLAEPLHVLPNNDLLLSRLVELCQNESIEKIVVGISENQMARETQAFVAQLQTVVQAPIELFDETLSSYTVLQKLRAGGKSGNKSSKAPIDHLAAAEILQEWLDTHSARENQTV